MMRRLILLALAAAFAVGCGKTTDDPDDTTSAELASSAQELGSAAGAGSTGIGRVADELFAAIERTTCSSIAFACSNKVSTRNFSSPSDGYCTRGSSNGRQVFGKAILTFSAATDCNFDNAANGETVTHTFENHYVRRGNNGYKVLVYTAAGTVADKTLTDSDLKDFEGTARSGGTVLKKVDSTTSKLTIKGIHRRGLKPNGKYGFWHTLWSDTDAITVTKSGSERTLNGTMYVMHNRISRKVTKTLTNVKYESGCHFPRGGTTTFAYKNEAGTDVSVTVTWSSSGTCGKATIDNAANELDDATTR